MNDGTEWIGDEEEDEDDKVREMEPVLILGRTGIEEEFMFMLLPVGDVGVLSPIPKDVGVGMG